MLDDPRDRTPTARAGRGLVARYRDGDWISWPLIAFTASLFGLGVIGVLVLWLASGHGTLDEWNRPIGTDFSGAYVAGRMALEGRAASVYDLAQHLAAQARFHHRPGVDVYGWHYPPYFLLVMAGLAALPYLPALLLWQGLSFAGFALVLQRILPGRTALIATAGFPAVLVCLGHGQNALLTAALFGGALLALADRPILAGLLLGCLAYKPQFGLVVPVALVAGGHWRAIASALATIAVLTLATVLAWGWPIWQAFIASGRVTRTIVLEQGATGWQKIISIFSWIRMAGGSIEAAYIAQSVVALFVIVTTAVIWKSRTDRALKGAALIIASLLATPYALDYDLVLLGPAIALLVARGLDRGFIGWEKTVLALAWLVPIVTRSVGALVPVQLAFCVMAWLYLLVLVKARRDRGGGQAARLSAIAHCRVGGL